MQEPKVGEWHLPHWQWLLVIAAPALLLGALAVQYDWVRVIIHAYIVTFVANGLLLVVLNARK